MLIEATRLVYPKLYAAIRDNPECFLKSGSRYGQDEEFTERRETILRDAFEGITAAEADTARSALVERLFPRTGKMGYGSDWEEGWAAEQRVCSSSYFHRYFQYAVPVGDVSDSTIKTILTYINAGDGEAVLDILKSAASSANAGRLIEKLHSSSKFLQEPTSCCCLAMGLVHSGQFLPREKGPFVTNATFRSAAVLIARLVKASTSDMSERGKLAGKLVKEANPVVFGVECLRWLRKGDDEPEDARVIAPAAEERIGRVLADRIKKLATETPLWVRLSDDAQGLFWIWKRYGAPREVSGYLRRVFNEIPSEVDGFLLAYTPTAWGGKGIPHKSDFRRDSYDAVTELIEPDYLMEKLHARYGAELVHTAFYQNSDVPVGLRVARQFAHNYHQLRASRNETSSHVGNPETEELR